MKFLETADLSSHLISKSYLFSSVIVAFCLSTIFFFRAEELPLYSLSLLLVVHYLALRWWPLALDKIWSFIFAQVFVLVALSFESQNSTPLFFILFPLMLSHFSPYISSEDKARHFTLYGLIASCLLIFWSINQQTPILNFSLDFWVAILFLITPVLASVMGERSKSRALAFQAGEQVESQQLFVHDLVNAVHGLQLYIDTKLAGSKRNLTQYELAQIQLDLKSIKSLIKDYYHIEHKNLYNTFQWVDRDMVRNCAQNLTENFLASHVKEYDLEFELDDFDCDFSLHLPSFIRIYSNLVKNIAEKKSSQAHIKIFVDKNFLVVETKNSLSQLQARDQNLAQQLAQAITLGQSESLTRATEAKGLLSTHRLSHSQGGSFHFWISDDYWCNRVLLPLKKMQKLDQKAWAA